MFGSRTAIAAGCCAFVVVLAGCGGSVEHSPSGSESSAGAGGRSGPAGASGNGGTSSVAGSAPVAGQSSAGSGGGGFPNLPDDPPPVTGGCDLFDQPPSMRECDPFGANTCFAGSACYPFVDHPEGAGCDAQSYGTVCLPVGIGTQGMRCGDDTGDWCAAGHVCVVGQRAGKRCAKLCQLEGAAQCEGGLVCGDLDVAGYGVCG